MELEHLLSLIEAVSESELTGLKYEENGVKLHLTKKQDQVQVISVPAGNCRNNGTDNHMLIAEGSCVTGAAGSHATGSGGGIVTDTADGTVTDNADNNASAAGKLITSPLVGTFYTAPSEDAEPFVTVGSPVKKGQTLAIVEAMKLMNEIDSDYDGTITEILAENGQAVEYGQPLFRVQ